MENYRTRDFQISTLLYASGKRLASVEYEPKVCWFVFEDGEACKKIVTDFYGCGVELNAKRLFESQQTIKQIIFNKNP